MHQATEKERHFRDRISAQGLVQDIRTRFGDEQLQHKYSLKKDALHYVIRRLVDNGVMTEFEMYGRKTLSDSDLMRALSEPGEDILTCLFCGNPILDDGVGCPQCERLLEEFADTLIMDVESEKQWTPQPASKKSCEIGRPIVRAFVDACRDGHIDHVSQFLEKQVDVNSADDSGTTPLIAAALAGRDEVVELLLGRQADVHRRDMEGKTALDHATAEGHANIIRLLTKTGASGLSIARNITEEIDLEEPDAEPTTERTAEPKAALNSPESQYVPANPFIAPPAVPEPLELCTCIPFDDKRESDHETIVLLKSAGRGILKQVEALLNQGLSANSCSVNGNTPLMRASFRGHLEVMRLLLERGASVNAMNTSGGTALIYAIRYGHVDAAKLLLENGASPDSKTPDGDTGLMMACLTRNLAMVAALLENGADVNASNDGGDTALMRVCHKGYAEIAEVLINKGAAPNARNTYGNTALMKASLRGYASIVDLLLKAGALVNVTNLYGNTALMKACHGGHIQVAELLLAAGADVTPTDLNGWTAFMRAQKTGRQDLVDLLQRRQPH